MISSSVSASDMIWKALEGSNLFGWGVSPVWYFTWNKVELFSLLSNYIIDMFTTWFHEFRIPNFFTNFAPIRTSLICLFICCCFSSKQWLKDWWKFGIRNRKLVKGCSDQLINLENRYCNIVLAFLFLQQQQILQGWGSTY